MSVSYTHLINLPDDRPFGYGILLIRLIFCPVLEEHIGRSALSLGQDFPFFRGDLDNEIVVHAVPPF